MAPPTREELIAAALKAAIEQDPLLLQDIFWALKDVVTTQLFEDQETYLSEDEIEVHTNEIQSALTKAYAHSIVIVDNLVNN